MQMQQRPSNEIDGVRWVSSMDEMNGTTNTTTTCRDIAFNGDDIAIRKPGTYLAAFNATTAATAAGVEEIQMFRDGNSVPGSHALETAAAGDMSSMAFSTLVTVECCMANLSFRSVPATTIRVANVVIAEQEV